MKVPHQAWITLKDKNITLKFDNYQLRNASKASYIGTYHPYDICSDFYPPLKAQIYVRINADGIFVCRQVRHSTNTFKSAKLYTTFRCRAKKAAAIVHRSSPGRVRFDSKLEPIKKPCCHNNRSRTIVKSSGGLSLPGLIILKCYAMPFGSLLVPFYYKMHQFSNIFNRDLKKKHDIIETRIEFSFTPSFLCVNEIVNARLPPKELLF